MIGQLYPLVFKPPKAIDDAVMDSNEAHQNQMMQLLSDPAKAAGFARVVFDLLSQSNKQ